MLIYEFKIHLDVKCVSVMIFDHLLLYYLNNILTKLLYWLFIFENCFVHQIKVILCDRDAGNVIKDKSGNGCPGCKISCGVTAKELNL